MSSSPAAAPTRARSVNGPLPQLLVGPSWLRLVPVRVVFLVVLAIAVLRGRDWSGRSYGALVRPLSSRDRARPPSVATEHCTTQCRRPEVRILVQVAGMCCDIRRYQERSEQPHFRSLLDYVA